MTCFIARNMLSELVDDALDSAREGELSSHLAGCEACSRELSEIRRMRQMLRGLPVHAAPADFLAKVRAKAEQKSALERLSLALSPLLRPRVAGGIAVAASVMLGVTVLLENREASLWDLGGAPAPMTADRVSPKSDANEENGKLAAFEKESDLKAGEDLLDGKKAGGGDVGGLAAAQVPADSTAVRGGDGFEQRKNGVALAEREAKVQAQSTPDAVLANKVAAPPAPAATSTPAAMPAKTTVALGRTEGSSHGTGAGPNQAGLYYATPAPGGAAGSGASVSSTATKDVRTDGDDARNVARQSASASEPAIVAKVESAPEPAFDVESSGGGRRRDAAKKEKAASGKAAAAPEEERAQEYAESPVMAGAVEAQDEVTETIVASDKPASRAASAPAVQARFTSTHPMAPAKVLEIAAGMGATAITKTPPSLGKVGVSTTVVVEMPAASVEAFREKLASEGSFEVLGTLPSGKVRLRIEVVRE